MIKYNYHTHTIRCGHASGKDEEYVLAAIKAGFKVLGFSDHAPYRDHPSSFNRMDWSDLDGYIRSIEHLKRKYEDQIEIHIGLETEFFPEMLEDRRELKDKVEYLILGQHFWTFDHSSSFFRTNTEEEIMRYAQLVCGGIDSGLFTYVAHPDVFMNKQDDFTPACEKAAHMIGKKAKEKGIPLEINIRGVSKGKRYFPNGEQYYYPHKDFWRIIAMYGVKAVIGMDAHAPRSLLDTAYIDEGLEELRDLNIEIIKEPFI